MFCTQIGTGMARAAACLLIAVTVAGAAPEKKVVYYGWRSRDTAFVRLHWRLMERLPFDGIGITVAIDPAKPTTGDGATENLLGWHTFGPTAFDHQDFQSAIADLQTPAWTKFTDNFLPAIVATADQDHGLTWFDDARWSIIENNWRVLLKIARDGRCRGILLDPEHYDYACELFSHANHRAQRVDKSFDEYTAKARRRGAQLGAAVRELFPGITIAMLYGYNLADAEPSRYSLLPAFLDGLREAASGASFVDLYEFGHHFTTRRQFLDGYAAIKKVPGMQAGFSLSLDRFSPASFRPALQAAREVSERYVWIYSEKTPAFYPPFRLSESYLKAFAPPP